MYQISVWDYVRNRKTGYTREMQQKNNLWYAPPPIESSYQSVNPNYVWTWSSSEEKDDRAREGHKHWVIVPDKFPCVKSN